MEAALFGAAFCFGEVGFACAVRECL